MTTKHLIIMALLLSVYVLNAQTEAKPATVRIKTKTIINGVETVKDTVFQSNDPAITSFGPGKEMTKSLSGTPQIVIMGGQSDKMDLEFTIDSIIKKNGEMTELKEGSQFIIKKVHCGATKEEIDGVKEFITIRIEKRIDIQDATTEEVEQLNKQTGINYKKLELEKLNFFPNPSNGKFNLSFSTPKKSDTEISIQNIEGKMIYQEKLPAFSGTYSKEIDISQNPKGAYFIKIVQGDSAQVKRIVIE